MPGLDEDTSTEDKSVRDWHETFLCQLGVSPLPAAVFADDVDPHQVARLIRDGCPPDLALDIVR